VGLRAEVVDLVRARDLEDAPEHGAVGEVAVVQVQPRPRLVRVLVEVVDAVRVERRRAADDPVDLVALREQQLGEVRAVLARDAGEERDAPGSGWRKSLRKGSALKARRCSTEACSVRSGARTARERAAPPGRQPGKISNAASGATPPRGTG
jgi:hypothetical protein